MNKVVLKLLLVVSILSVAGCGRYAHYSPQEMIKKGRHSVRDRENDYHTSYFVPSLQVPADLSQLDPTRAQVVPEGLLDGKPCMQVKPPGVL